MDFNDHSRLAGQHAFLSPSYYHWINYDDHKLRARLLSVLAARRGDELHAFAKDAIRLGIKLPKTTTTLNMYVNDSIGYHMVPEQVLFYSENAFGTTDAIGFRRNTLRIHDLKTGITPTSMHQLEVYAALFCLEYHYKPHDITTELRIYQTDECRIHEPDPDVIAQIMEKIVIFDRKINEIKREVL